MVTINDIELLSPAGDMECFNSALDFGANAIYLAGKQFGMRAGASNFDMDNLKIAVNKAHQNGAKVYVTCNTLPRSNEIELLPEFLQNAQNIGVDAFIIADLGVMNLAGKYAPNVERHISTQTGVVNYETANVLYNMGASRVVLAREMTFDDIREIRAKIPKDMEIEVFVHGSMCVSFSGRCLISSYMTGRDANRGDCAQPCRWKYHLFEQNREGQYFPVEEDSDGTFLYNSRDLCMIEHIPELVESGITSLKIEGRAKSAYYTAVTTNAYRHAINDYFADKENYSLKPWIRQELDKVSHREYNTGFFFGGEPGQVVNNGGYIREYDVVAVCEEIDCEIMENINGLTKVVQRNRFFKGDEVDILTPSGIPFLTTVKNIYNIYGQEVEVANHAMEELYINTDADIPVKSIIRKKR